MFQPTNIKSYLLAWLTHHFYLFYLVTNESCLLCEEGNQSVVISPNSKLTNPPEVG